MGRNQLRYGLHSNQDVPQTRKREFGRVFDDQRAPPTPYYPDLSVPRLRTASGYDYYDDTPTRSRIIVPEIPLVTSNPATATLAGTTGQEEPIDETMDKFKKLVDATSAFVSAGADFVSSVFHLGTRALSSYWDTVMANYRKNYVAYTEQMEGFERKKKRRRIGDDVPGAFRQNRDNANENEDNGLNEDDERNKAFIADMPVPLRYTQTRPAFTGRRPLFEPITNERITSASVRSGTPMDLDTPDEMILAQKPQRWRRSFKETSVSTEPPRPNKITTSTTTGSLYPDISETPFSKQNARKKVSFENNCDFEKANINTINDNDSNKVRATIKENEFADRLRRTKLGQLSYSQKPESRSDTHFNDSTKSRKSVLLTNTKFKKYVFDESRLDNRRPLGYPSSWYYAPIELPEEIQSENDYIDAYMRLADTRKRSSYENENRSETTSRGYLQQIDDNFESLQSVEAAFSPGTVDRVDGLWARRDYSTAIVNAFRITITVYDIQTLRPGHWINDNIVDFYFNLIQQRSVQSNGVLPKTVVFSTHFFSSLQKSGYKGVAKWAERRGVDVTKPDFILVPINRYNIHWCLAVINNRDLRFELYDSMNGAGAVTLELLRDYMRKQTLATYPYSDLRQLGYDRYDLCPTLPCPQQRNSFDCGAFVCRMANLYAQDLPIMSFAQADIPVVRRQVAYEIVTQSLK